MKVPPEEHREVNKSHYFRALRIKAQMAGGLV